MPEMDGVETLNKMREIDNFINSDTPIIALTADAVAGARQVYLDIGFNDYLAKPIVPKDLDARFGEVLAYCFDLFGWQFPFLVERTLQFGEIHPSRNGGFQQCDVLAVLVGVVAKVRACASR